jgi:hypothetical protein
MYPQFNNNMLIKINLKKIIISEVYCSLHGDHRLAEAEEVANIHKGNLQGVC